MRRLKPIEPPEPAQAALYKALKELGEARSIAASTRLRAARRGVRPDRFPWESPDASHLLWCRNEFANFKRRR